MKKIVFIVLAFTLACTSQSVSNEKTVIKGKFKNASSDTLYLSVLHYDKITDTDTIILDPQGNFEHQIKENGINFYVLVYKGANFVRLLIEKGESIELDADIYNMQSTYTVKGSKGSQLIKSIESKTAKATAVVDSLTKIVNQKKDAPDYSTIFPVLDSVYKKTFNTLKEDLKAIVKENISSLASVVAMSQSLSGMSVFNRKDDLELFAVVNDSVYKKYLDNSFAVYFYNMVQELKMKEKEKNDKEQKLKPGLTAPEIIIFDKNKKLINLSSLKGKVVLLKFWDSHCPICKGENIQLKEVYAKYKSKGFEIMAISVDPERKEWIDYLSANAFTWLQCWLYDEPQNTPSPITANYYVEEIPVAHLIGKDGKFIATRIKMENIEKELEKYLK
ncbi:MAG: Thiol-disulfide oxidoreductase ResA [Bacteroidetes bacterium ADurb.Bin408]|nr:MAG: Thiol-disulfide oxidoreductase ResA [Bacteroidetes bacterium ADurb.Bin408]